MSGYPDVEERQTKRSTANDCTKSSGRRKCANLMVEGR